MNAPPACCLVRQLKCLVTKLLCMFHMRTIREHRQQVHAAPNTLGAQKPGSRLMPPRTKLCSKLRQQAPAAPNKIVLRSQAAGPCHHSCHSHHPQAPAPPPHQTWPPVTSGCSPPPSARTAPEHTCSSSSRD